jgi:hypothetical protein
LAPTDGDEKERAGKPDALSAGFRRGSFQLPTASFHQDDRHFLFEDLGERLAELVLPFLAGPDAPSIVVLPTFARHYCVSRCASASDLSVVFLRNLGAGSQLTLV